MAKVKTACIGHHYVPVRETPPRIVTVPLRQGSSSAPRNKVVKLIKVYCPYCWKVKWRDEARGSK